jgi:hypothetical protein
VFPEDLIESALIESTRVESAGTPRGALNLESRHFEPPDRRIAAYKPPKNRLWLHLVLLVLTMFTTTLVGAHMQYNFDHNLPFFDLGRDLLDIFTVGFRSPQLFLGGVPFSLTLLTILMAHEFGH